MLSRNIGDKQRRSNREPPYAAASQEVISRSALLAREIKADGKDHDEIHRDDRDIDPSQRLVGKMRRTLDHNPPSPLSYTAAHLAADRQGRSPALKENRFGTVSQQRTSRNLELSGNAPSSILISNLYA